MALITIRKLQREFGLSYATAAGIIREQSRLARKRYRMLGVLFSCGMLIFAGLILTGTHLPHGAQYWIPLAVLPLILSQHYLSACASRELILTAARAQQTHGNAGPHAAV